MAAGCVIASFLASPFALAEGFTTGGIVISTPAVWTPEQTPVDFLDLVGLRTKARWRQLYRPPPPTPPTDRPRVAFTLGGLISDSFLALQAEDVQQFRNTNQDVLSYCRVLGLSDKITPRLMSMAKLAEMSKWGDLRQEAVDGQQELTRILREQRDDDLAVLVDLGSWMRGLEISSTVVAEVPDATVRPLSIGSLDLLKDLRQRYAQLSAPARAHSTLASVDDLLGFLIRAWSGVGDQRPSQEVVTKTRDKISNLMRRLTLK